MEPPRRPSMNLFVRLRISKQDKIAANVAQHIRAVRAAEALDRRTHFKRQESFSYPSAAAVPRHLPPPQMPSAPPVREHVACQTSYDLLESLLPSLRKRALRHAETDEAPRKSAVRRHQRRVEVEYKAADAAAAPLQLLGKKSQYNKLQAMIGDAEGVSETSFSPAVSQDSLIDGTSSIIEESASTGSDDTVGGAVYKNIIINLGGSHERRLVGSSAATSSANLSLPSGGRSQDDLGEASCKWSSPNGNPRRMEN